jgi:NTP pyrophosphatase (non-canonical NTP hydrolase)
MVTLPAPETFHDYQNVAQLTDRGSGGGVPSFAALGLFGEVGSVLAEVKKLQRDNLTFRSHYHVVVEELGDVLWYLSTIASRAKIKLDDVAQDAAAFFNPAFVSTPVRFDDFERVGLTINFSPSASYALALRKLAAQTGAVIEEDIDTIPKDQLTALLAMSLHYMAEVSYESGIPIIDVAQANVKKTLRRWPTPRFRKFTDTFDEGYPPYERLPRKLVIDVFEVQRAPEQYFVIQRIGGLNIGDRLTDNIEEEDDYRFHDVFHYAYAANLHWSPVLRALLKNKRKSVPRVDEAQDGARAILIEEGVATYVFNMAKSHLFAGTNVGDMSYDLLKSIQSFVSGFEVEVCPPWLWEKAILEGFEAFRFLKSRRRGRLTMDLERRELRVAELP